MKYKYIVGLLVALSLNNAFAADEPIPTGNYQDIYLAFKCGGTKEINAALANNQTFNHKDDTDIIRSNQTGFALRKAVIGLSAADLQAVVETNHEFFKTSLGISLVYGWTLNQFKEPVTPYYIGHYFSFDKLFQGLAGKMDDNNVVTFLRSAFTRGLSAVDDDRWAFYDHMLYLPYAIEQVRLTGARTAGTSALSIYDVITIAHRTKEEAKSEKARVPGRATHLDDLSAAARIDCDTCDFVDLQKYTVAKSEFHGRIEPNLLATFQSLPADTKEDYVFMGKSLKDHMLYFRVVNEVEADAFVMRVPVPVECKYKGLDSVADVATNITQMQAFHLDTLSSEQFEKILRLAVTEDINGIDEHTPGHETLLPYMNYKRDYLGTLDHTDVDLDLDKLVAEEDLAGYLDTIDASEHDPAKTELVGKSIKTLAIELRDELLLADAEKKREAVEKERKNAIVIAFQNLSLRLPTQKRSKLQFHSFTDLILETREMASQMIDEKFIEGATASKLAEHINTLSTCSKGEEWTPEVVPQKLAGSRVWGSTKTQIQKQNKEIAEAEKSNKTKQEKIAAAKALVIIMRDTNLTA